MKIVHINLCGPVTDNWNYQDNLLTKYHAKLDNEVTMITSEYIWHSSGSLGKSQKENYYNDDGIKMIRLKNKFNTTINSKFKLYKNLVNTLTKENPDILFIHGVQFLNIISIKRYLKKNKKVKVYVDNHADFSNSASNIFSKYILHKLIWKKMAQTIMPFTSKFYGVMPSRVSFLEEIYKIPSHLTELLVMGADDEKIDYINSADHNLNLKQKYNIRKEDFVIVTGGKIDLAKTQSLLLMKAINELNRDNVKLVVFGSIDNKIKKEFEESLSSNVIYIGWMSSEETYRVFNMADLVCFPGRHSVFWEQVVGLGKPMIVKYWEGTTHIDIGGNCEFLYENSEEEIRKLINNLLNDKKLYLQMLRKAESAKKNKFLYSNIAKLSINDHIS